MVGNVILPNGSTVLNETYVAGQRNLDVYDVYLLYPVA